MPADPINYTDLRFDEQGKPYWTTQSGRKAYLAPAQAAQLPDARARQWAASQGEVYGRDASGNVTGVQSTAAPHNTFAHQNNGWNPDTGQFDMSLNQGGLMGLIEGGAGLVGAGYAAPAIAGPVGGSGAAGAAGATGASSAGAGSVAGGTLATTTAPGVSAAAASGAVTPAAGLGAAGATGASSGGATMGIGGILDKIDKYSDRAGALGSVLSQASQGSANQRTNENNSALNYARALNERERDTFNAGITSGNYQREGQDRERRKALLAALLGGVQDAHSTPGNPAIAAKMPTMTGGLRPSALSGSRESILSLLGGQADPSAPAYTPATLPELQTAGAGENITGGMGLGFNILKAIGRSRRPQTAGGA